MFPGHSMFLLAKLKLAIAIRQASGISRATRVRSSSNFRTLTLTLSKQRLSGSAPGSKHRRCTQV
jgi:hypothetical protein